MKTMIFTISLLAALSVRAADIKFEAKNDEITKVIEIYSKASGQKFVLDPSVRGKITILNPEPVSLEEAFNQLSTALAVNSFAISKQGETMVVGNARSMTRNYVEVSTEVPSLKPERIYTWIYTVKNIPAERLNRDLRILLSKDGEMVVNSSANQLIFTDWASSLNRAAEVLKKIDVKPDPATARLVEESRRQEKKPLKN